MGSTMDNYADDTTLSKSASLENISHIKHALNQGLTAGVHMKAVLILAGYYVFYADILFTFQAIKNLSAHLTYLCFGLFWKFFGDF